MKHLEYDLQVAVCKYLSSQYPDIFFLSDTIANLKLSKTQASRNKKIQKNGFKCPDIIILEPRNNFSGLLIELKLTTPFKKNGEIKASDKDHLKGQLETLDKLNKIGYSAHFSWSFDMTKEIIDNYLKQ
jgi:hypothetical protein